MFKKPPTEAMLELPFGILLNVYMKLSLGNNAKDNPKWTNKSLAIALEGSDAEGGRNGLEKSISLISNWTSGTNKPDAHQNFPLLLKLFCENEKEHGSVWAELLKYRYAEPQTKEIFSKVKQSIIGGAKFGSEISDEKLKRHVLDSRPITTEDINTHKNQKYRTNKNTIEAKGISVEGGAETNTVVTPASPYLNKRYLLLAAAFSLIVLAVLVSTSRGTKPEPTKVHRNLKGSPDSSIVDDIDLKKAFFTNVGFCSEDNFDHDLNKCLKLESQFQHGIKKVNISFEGKTIKEDSRFTMKWYRYGELFVEGEKIWTETFAHDLKYASTFWRLEEPLDTGLYQVQFFMKGHIIGETSFNIVK